MKRFLMVAWYVVMIMALVALPVLADNGGPQPQPQPQPVPVRPQPQPQPERPGRGVALMGPVISCDGETLTLTVLRGGELVEAYIESGDPLTLSLDPERTRVHYYGTPAREPISPDEWVDHLVEGAPVMVRAIVPPEDEVAAELELTAISVVIGVPSRLEGTVVSYTNDSALLVTVTDGGLLLEEYIESGEPYAVTLIPDRTRVRVYGSARREWVDPEEWPQLFVPGAGIQASVICQADGATAMMVVVIPTTDAAGD